MVYRQLKSARASSFSNIDSGVRAKTAVSADSDRVPLDEDWQRMAPLPEKTATLAIMA